MKLISFITLFFLFNQIHATNPVIDGVADPHMKVFNNTIYMSVGTDKSIENKNCIMEDWKIYSTTDFVNWNKEVVIEPKNTFLGDNYQFCWATDIATKNGKYYIYLSFHNLGTAVLKADKANGPYNDVLGKPLLENNLYDPTVFADDDGKAYIITGLDGKVNGGIKHYQIARLNDDMISLAETPRDLMTDQPTGFGEPNGTDANYFHKYNAVYYLSTRDKYMTSTNIYGPYTNMRSSGVGGHKSYCEYNGQWYTAYNNFYTPYFRKVNLTYVHYKKNGDIVDDKFFFTNGIGYAVGVGNYDAAWTKIEAEWFFKRVGSLVKKECPAGGFEIQNIQNNDILNFPNIFKLKPNAEINFQVSSESKGEIEIHEGSEKGKLLGTCKIENTGSFSTYKTFSCKLSNTSDNANLYFVFIGGKGELMRIDWFNFNAASTNQPLQPPWLDASIGTPAITGSTSYFNNTFTINAAGIDVVGASDQCHYIYQPLNGDGEIIAKIASCGNMNIWSKAGIMIRSSLDANAAMVIAQQRPDNYVNFSNRPTDGGNCVNIINPSTEGGTATNKWLKLNREGNVFRAYYSTVSNLGPWIAFSVASTTVGMNTDVLIGFYYVSHNASSLGAATFTDVSCINSGGTAATSEILDNQPSIKITPDPALDFINITLDGFSNPEIQIIDMKGIVIYQTSLIDNNKISISTRTIGLRGIYFVKVEDNNISKTTKLIIK